MRELEEARSSMPSDTTLFELLMTRERTLTTDSEVEVHDADVDMDAGVNVMSDHRHVLRPPMSAEMLATVRDAWSMQGRKDELLVAKTEVTRHSMRKLRHQCGCIEACKCRWLDDIIVDRYLKLLMQRSEATTALPSVLCLTTFFYSNLMNKDKDRASPPWMSRIRLFDRDMIMIPMLTTITTHGKKVNHWCLSTVDFRRKEIKYYDPYHGESSPTFMSRLWSYLDKASQQQRGHPLNFEQWTATTPQSNPTQTNNFDCGVFMCVTAEYLSRDADLSFTQGDMGYYRQSISHQILTGAVN